VTVSAAQKMEQSEQILRQRKIFIYKNFGISDRIIFVYKKEGIFEGFGIFYRN